MTSVSATLEERRRPLPGDELIPVAAGSLTHAVTIARPPEDVWPWLAQMGAGRGGWYSYDRLDNGGRRSAWRIEPALQAPATGDVFPALPGRRDGFKLVAQDPERSLVLSWPTPDGGGHAVTWSFVLDPLDTSRTRLLVRARGGAGYRFHGLPEWLSLAVVRPVHFVMERKQLIGIARRAEREPGAGGALLDRFVPEHDIVEHHQIKVKAPPDLTFAAACHVDFQRSPIIHAIVRGREWMMGSRAEDRATPRGLLAETKGDGVGRAGRTARPRHRDGRGHEAVGAERHVSRARTRGLRTLRRTGLRQDRLDTRGRAGWQRIDCAHRDPGARDRCHVTRQVPSLLAPRVARHRRHSLGCPPVDEAGCGTSDLPLGDACTTMTATNHHATSFHLAKSRGETDKRPLHHVVVRGQ